VTTFLIWSGVAVAWILSLLVRPFGACWLCLGRGNLRRKGRAPRCLLCGGHGRRQRFGSRAVHRVRRQVAAHWREP
jgi:hypothetical protein